MDDSKNIVLVVQIYVPDNWYGKYYRIILREDNDSFQYFQTKKSANSYLKKFKSFCKTSFKSFIDEKGKPVKIKYITGEIENFPEYTHVSMGPSLYYSTTYISVKDIENEL